MVGPRTLTTAAHCVYKSSYGYAESLTIIPARNGSLYPYGTYKSIYISIPKAYKTDTSTANDIAVVNINSLYTYGSYMPKYIPDSLLMNKKIKIAGYPGSGFQSSDPNKKTILGEQWKCTGKVTYLNGRILRHNGDFLSGMSGSALIYDGNIVAIGNKEPNFDSSFNAAVRIDEGYYKWIYGIVQNISAG